MNRRLLFALVSIVLLLNGCSFIAAYIADSQRAKQDLDVPYGDALDMVKSGLKAENIHFKTASITEKVAKVRGTLSDGSDLLIKVFKVSDTTSKIEVRVGSSEKGKEAAEGVLQAILISRPIYAPEESEVESE